MGVRVGRRIGSRPLRFGVWQVSHVLGRGASATVYDARSSSGAAGAVKVLHAEFAADPRWRKRFAREARLFGDLSAPGLPRLLDQGVTALGTPFLVLERLYGRPLSQIAQQVDRVEVETALGWADSLLGTLEALHERGVLHRDIKPSNVFLTDSQQLKLLDLGIAGELREAAGTASTRGLLGTPAFMSPEQARGRWDQVDARSDLWSVGALLFTLLTGRHVHQAETDNEQLALAIACPAPSLGACRPDLDPTLIRVVDRALSYDPDGRFSDAFSFRAALREPRSFSPMANLGRDLTLRDPRSHGGPSAGRSMPRVQALPFSTALLTTLTVCFVAAQDGHGRAASSEPPVAHRIVEDHRVADITPRSEPAATVLLSVASAPRRASGLVAPRRAQFARDRHSASATPLVSDAAITPSPTDAPVVGAEPKLPAEQEPARAATESNPLDQRL